MWTSPQERVYVVTSEGIMSVTCTPPGSFKVTLKFDLTAVRITAPRIGANAAAEPMRARRMAVVCMVEFVLK
jgi:uncharacterized protein YPO0396